MVGIGMILLYLVSISMIFFALYRLWARKKMFRQILNIQEADFRRRLERSRSRKIAIRVHPSDESEKEA